MAMLTVSVPDDVLEFIESNVGESFADAGEVVTEFMRDYRDGWRLEELRTIVDEARAGGICTRTVDERIAEGERILRERGIAVRE